MGPRNKATTYVQQLVANKYKAMGTVHAWTLRCPSADWRLMGSHRAAFPDNKKKRRSREDLDCNSMSDQNFWSQ